jgi:hypothetical protein
LLLQEQVLIVVKVRWNLHGLLLLWLLVVLLLLPLVLLCCLMLGLQEHLELGHSEI